MDYRLTLLNKIKLKLSRHILVGEERKNGWKDSLPVYAFKCPKHGIVKNHIKGFSGRLECPICTLKQMNSSKGKKIYQRVRIR